MTAQKFAKYFILSLRKTNLFIPTIILIVFLFAPRTPGVANGYLPLFLLFALGIWKRNKIRIFLSNLTWLKSKLVKFLFIAIVWSLLVERVLGRQQEARYPVLVFLISLTFTIPYFVIWHKIIGKFKNLTFKEVFLYAGLSGALAQMILTPKVLSVFGEIGFLTALFMALYNFLQILVMFGMLTSLPFALLFEDKFGESTISNAKKKLLSIGSVFFALPFLIITIIILRVLIKGV